MSELLEERLNEAAPVPAVKTQVYKPGPDVVEMLSDLYEEPAWMRDSRREAWRQYMEISLPDANEEAWRRTDLAQYPLDNIRIVFSSRELDGIFELPPCWHYTLAPVEQVSGALVHCNSARSYMTMRRGDAQNGVILEDLHTVLATHGDLVKKFWMQSRTTRSDYNKFTAMNAALWHGGTFVYVPAGVRVARPLQSLIAYDADNGTGLHRTMIVAEKGSHVTLIQDRVSQEKQDELNVEVVEIYAEQGAWVRYVSLQHWGEQRYTVNVQEARVQQDANLVWVNSALGGKMTKEFIRSNLAQQGGRSLLYGSSFMRDHQHLDQSTYQHHQAADTYSDLLWRNVLRDRARTVFYGMIRVEADAVRTQGYQVNNNLMLDDARAHAIPGLEILANDVRCSHGATVSRINPDQLFYLQARGIPLPEAERLVVQGYIRPVIERVPLAHMRDRLEEEIANRFWD
ncbi:MAG: Fe-S cluster assembly protein SufD [Anaerolineae bacterium]|nr:Fe-S cluster assembly protein SufD [Anaerolineae bacterium]